MDKAKTQLDEFEGRVDAVIGFWDFPVSTTIDVIVNEGERLCDLPDQDSYSYKIANLYLGGQEEAELEDKYKRVAAALQFEFDS